MQFSDLIHYQSKRPLKTLLYLYKQDGGNLGLSLFFYLIKHSPEWLRPLVMANVIDIISSPSTHSIEELWLNGALLSLTIAQNIPTHYWHIRFMSLATRKMEWSLRRALAQRLQELSISFYHRHSTGTLQAKLLKDVEAIQTLTSQLFQLLPSTILTILIALCITAVRAPAFLLFFAATVPLAVCFMHFLKAPLRQRNQRLRQQGESLSAYLVEMLKMIPLTRAHGAEPIEMERTQQELTRLQSASLQVDSINAIANASAWVTLRLFSCLCLIGAAFCAYQGIWGITVGSVILLTGYFDSLTNSVVQILNVLPQISKGFDAIQSVGEILESREIEKNHHKLSINSVEGKFSFQGVGFTYPDTNQPALENFSLEVQPGETIAFAGPSGAGKSTLLNLIIGLIQPDSGRIFLDNHELSQIDLRSYRRRLSVVSQETILFQGTVRENLLYGTKGVEEKSFWQAVADAHALEFIEQLPQGIETLIGENGVKLSGGQRQRLAIARALLRQPRILLLDEATSSLDSEAEYLIQDALSHLMSQRTTFVVAHRLSTIRQANRIIVLEKGKIVEIGNYCQLVAKGGFFSRLHTFQTGMRN
ncbi:MAG: ABC transporter ATP-binding protein [Cyanobacteria bacterium P01_G01_bin.49]